MKNGQFTLYVTCEYQNISNRDINPVLYLVPVLEGSFTVPCLGRALINIGVITSQDILDAHSKPWISYEDVESVNGGNWWSGVKNVLSKIHDFIKRHGLVSKGLEMVHHPHAKKASAVAKALGYGEGDGGVLIGGVHHPHHQRHHADGHMDEVMYAMEGDGVMAGGRNVTKAQLRKRMAHY